MVVNLYDVKSKLFENFINDYILFDEEGSSIRWHNIHQLEKKNPKKYHLMMSSLIADIYQYLKWEEQFSPVKYSVLLGALDRAKSLEDAVRTSEYQKYAFLEVITSIFRMSLADKINVKNNALTTKNNEVIMKLDIFRITEYLWYYENGFILPNGYDKEYYLELYRYFLKTNKVPLKATDEFIKIVKGLRLYNKEQFRSLVKDMMFEYFIQYNYFKHPNCTSKELSLQELLRKKDMGFILDTISRDDAYLGLIVGTFTNYDNIKGEEREILLNNRKIYKITRRFQNKRS